VDAAELERRLTEQETLLELGLALAETLDLRRVLTVALEQAEQFCAAETSSIWELDEGSGELFFRVVRGQAAPEIQGIRIPLGEGIVGSVAAAGKAEGITDVTSEPRWRGDVSCSCSTRAIATASTTTTCAGCACSPGRSRTRSRTPGSTRASSAPSSRP